MHLLQNARSRAPLDRSVDTDVIIPSIFETLTRTDAEGVLDWRRGKTLALSGLFFKPSALQTASIL